MKKKVIAMMMSVALLLTAGCAGASVKENDPQQKEVPAETAHLEEPAKEELQMPSFQKVTMENPYEKAAYLLDMTYQRNGAANTLVSPLSLDMALGLVAGGAEGKTKEELASYLSKEDYGSFAAEYMEYAAQLNRNSEKEYMSDPEAATVDYKEEYINGFRTVFEIANSVWVSDRRNLIEAYADRVQKDFQAEIASVSFAPEQREETAGRINDWCKEKTHGLIPSVITKETIKEGLSMILINSLYFESSWEKSWKVLQDDFTDLDGTVRKQDMLKDTLFVYYENEHATGFSKYYRNGLEFIGILPKKTGDFEVGDLDIESLLNSRNLDADVDASMPKLNFDTTADAIVPILKSQGVETPFNSAAADFSGLIEMDPDENTYISDIIQKCRIELDENGTKAAAVTAAMMETMGMPVARERKEVYLNRPFAFLIYDRENDQIVFIGKVVSADS